MSSPLRSCEEDEGMVVNSEGGDFDEDDDDDGDPDGNASDINSPAAPRETAAAAAAAAAAAPGTVKEGLNWRTSRRRAHHGETARGSGSKGHAGSSRDPQLVPQIRAYPAYQRGRVWCAQGEKNKCRSAGFPKKAHV